MEGKANRVVSLLESVGIADRYIHSQRDGLSASEIDYEKTKTLLRSVIEQSKDYLSRAL